MRNFKSETSTPRSWVWLDARMNGLLQSSLLIFRRCFVCESRELCFARAKYFAVFHAAELQQVDACHKIAPDTACKTEAEVKEKASEFYINYLVISQEFNPQTNDHKSYYVYSSINERFDLEDNRNIILNQQVEKNVVIRSEDHLFGTSFYSDENDMFNYKTKKKNFLRGVYSEHF
jgi:hypothetical protein